MILSNTTFITDTARAETLEQWLADTILRHLKFSDHAASRYFKEKKNNNN